MTRRIWIPLLLVLGFVAAGLCGLWFAWRLKEPALRERIVAEAKARGLELEMEDFTVSAERIVLRGATVRPLGVRGLAARFETVTLELSGLGWDVLWRGTSEVALTSVEVVGADVHVLGSAPSLALELSRWSEQFPAAYDLPARATGVALGWRATSEEAPWLRIAAGEVTREADGGTFRAGQAIVLDQRVGSVGSSWSKREGRLVMGFGSPDPSNAPVHLEVLLDAPEPLARVELRRLPLSDLTGALGMGLPLAARTLEKTEVAAKAEFQLPPSLAPAAVPGKLEVTLFGFVPPHPPELEGIVSGDRTTFHTGFVVSEDQTTVRLSDTRVAAGQFVLEGDGLVRRQGEHADVDLRLSESLACVRLAGAAADSRLGKHWASLTRKLLQKYMQGAVEVKVRIEANTRDLAAARVTQTIGVGCGLQPLRPLTPDELVALSKQLPGLLAELPALPAGGVPGGSATTGTSQPARLPQGLPPLPKLPTSLPPLPRALPDAPPLPRFEVAPSKDSPAERADTKSDAASDSASN